MKKHLSLLLLTATMFVANFVLAQAPNSFNYQAVIRDGSGNLITTGLVNMRFTIRTGSSSGSSEYQETSVETPNQYGLVNHAVGTGTVVSGAITGVTWASGNKYLQVEVNTGGGFVDLGTQQLVSVPYAISSGDNQWAKIGTSIVNTNTGSVIMSTPTVKYEVPNWPPMGNKTVIAGDWFGKDTTYPQVRFRNDLSKFMDIGQNSNGDFVVEGNDNARLVVTNGGKVGIGTSIPTKSLHIVTTDNEIMRLEGGSRMYMTFAESGTYRGYLGSYSGAAEDIDFGTGDINTTGKVHLATQSMPRLTVAADGKVGIGTTTPLYPLHVAGSVAATIGGWFHEYTSSTLFYNNGSVNVSIRSDFDVLAQGFLAASDARIKKNIEHSQTASDLSTINQLKVTNYNYIDQVEKSKNLQKGFIAQEVEKVIPEAITKLTDFIPNIYAVADKVEFRKDGKAVITTKKPHELKANDVVRLITATKDDYKVEKVIDKHRFEVSGLSAKNDGVFVYGKKVDDFKVVNYDRIFTTGIGAIQELSKQVEALKSENAALKSELNNSNIANASLAADVILIKEQLNIRSQVMPK